ncbi:MAG: hypothetical protein WC389_13345 [Lutibacter sp.]|jgi:hypothetical protein
MLFQRNWEKVKVGDKVKAKKDVPALMEHAIQFDKDEEATIVVVKEDHIGIIDRYKDVAGFNKRKSLTGDFVGDWFK